MGLFCCLLTGCGVGTAGIVAAVVGNSGGSSSSAVVVGVADLQLVGLCSTESSPAIITFRLTDAQSRPATVRIQYRDPADNQLRDVQLIAVNNTVDCDGNTVNTDTNLTDLATSPTGVLHVKAWNFGGQLGPMPVVNVSVQIVVVDGGGNPLGQPEGDACDHDGERRSSDRGGRLAGGLRHGRRGKRKPAVHGLGLRLHGNPVNLIVDFLAEESFAMDPDVGWQRTHPVGSEGQPAPELSVPNVTTSPPSRPSSSSGLPPRICRGWNRWYASASRFEKRTMTAPCRPSSSRPR